MSIPADTGQVLRIEDLSVTFQTDSGAVSAVSGVDLTVDAGEIVAVVGESGSGKTVTARSVLGLLPETASASGRILLRSGDSVVDVLASSERALRRIRGTAAAMVFQEPTAVLNPVRTIGWQIGEGLRAHGRTSRADRRRRSIEILDLVGIPEPHRRIDHYPHQLSGGQKQRVVIAMALALRPTLIIADEPTTALDVTVQAEILDLLRNCRDELGAAILLITHNMAVVADLADQVAVMHSGRVVEQAPVADLFSAPQHSYTTLLLAAVPDLTAVLAGSEGEGEGGVDRPRSLSGAGLRDPAPGGESGLTDAGLPGTVQPSVRATRLSVHYPGRFRQAGFTAVDGVDFHIRPGEVLGLVGESGSGKTTIGRAVAGLVGVSSGQLEVLGTTVTGTRDRSLRAIRGRIGFVFQDPGTSFNPLLTIGECVAEPFRVHRPELGVRGISAKVGELLDAVQLTAAHASRYPHELSGGQRQRASLARAIAVDPALLIADEPTSALDVSVQAKVLELFAELQHRFEFAALFISHDLAVVEIVADRVAVLHRGRIVETGPVRKVLGDPQNAYTKRLLEALPVPDPRRQAQRRAARLTTPESIELAS